MTKRDDIEKKEDIFYYNKGENNKKEEYLFGRKYNFMKI